MARQRKQQGELAKLLGMSQPAVSRRVRGDVALDVNELNAIINWLHEPNLALELIDHPAPRLVADPDAA